MLRRTKIRSRLFLAVGLILSLWQGRSEAAVNAVVTQVGTSPAQLTMGSTVSITFQVTNSNTGGDVGERIYEMRFRLPGTGTVFSATTAAPAGWTRTAFSTTSVTFRANSWANTIATGNSLNFTLVMVLRTTTADVTESLRDIRARTTTSTGGPPFTRLGTDTDGPVGSWTVRSLLVAFQITDLSGNPVTVIQAGSSFRLVMTVTNRSSSSKTSITTNPNPPTTNETGTVTQVLTSTVYNPNPLTLAAGATGTITFTYSTAATDNGTISFTAFARNNTNTATSAAITSPILAVSRFSAALSFNPTCAYSGDNVTVTMTLTNSFPGAPPANNNNIINVTPTLTPAVGSPVALVSGPSPAAPNGPVLANGGTFVFTWVYQVSAAAAPGTVTFTGSASGFDQNTSGVRSTPTTTASFTIGGYTVTVNPTATNAVSGNEELEFSFTNGGCRAVNSVSISIPAGWTWNGDAYSVVDQSTGPPPNDVWGISGANPVVFTAPSVAAQLPLAGGADFDLTFSATPAAAGASVFTVTITDAGGVPDAYPVSVTVNAYDNTTPAQGNFTDTEVFKEEFR